MKRIKYLILGLGLLLVSCSKKEGGSVPQQEQAIGEHFSYIFNSGSDSVRWRLKECQKNW